MAHDQQGTPANGQYIGIMSGTSVDAVDAALVEINHDKCRLIDTATVHYDSVLRQSLLQLNSNPSVTLSQLIELEQQVAKTFAEAALVLLAQSATDARHICAVGSHGQTIYHQPKRLPGNAPGGTLQIGDPNTIARLTGIDVIADFRRADMAHGGQGAPLTPAFHQYALGQGIPKVILNLGGIANISVLDDNVIGFDTGPANTLMDAWSQLNLNQSYDKNGEWARTGKVHQSLLNAMLADNFFQRLPPKSTGPDYFNIAWLHKLWDVSSLPAADVQATLLELTAKSVVLAVKKYAPETTGLYVCGGGAHNEFLMARLSDHLAPVYVGFTAELGTDGDACEAMAFAWLAYRYKSGLTGNLPQVTGADGYAILGGMYPGHL